MKNNVDLNNSTRVILNETTETKDLIDFDPEEDYLRQVREIQEQTYNDTEIPLADDISSIALKKKLNVEGGRSVKKV